MTTLAANESSVQHTKAGSVTVKIYRGQNRGQPMFTVAWMVGERRFRRNFADEKRAVRFAKTQAKELSAGRVDASCISTTEAAEYREAQRRLAEEQQAAFNAFLDNPSVETEQKVALTADTNLTATRYAALRRAYIALRGRISAEAARIIRPAIDRALEALRTEHARRREIAEPVMSSKDRHPLVIEAKRAVESAETIATHLLWASDGKADKAPLELADVLMNGANGLTPNAGK